MSPLTFAADPGAAIPLHAVAADALTAWRETLPPPAAAWLEASGFAARAGQVAVIPDADGGLSMAVAGLGKTADHQRGRFLFADARGALPKGTYRLISDLSGAALDEAALGWLLSGYRFDRYAKNERPGAELVAPDGVDAARIEAMAAGEALTRDLINTPASDMGPPDLEAAARALAEAFGAEIAVITGEALLEQNFPMIHAVGRAADRAPRLLDMRWGAAGPRVTLVG